MFEFYQSQNLVSQYLKLIYHRGENPRHGAEMKGGGEGGQSTGGEHFGDNRGAELHMSCSHTLRDREPAQTPLKSSCCIFRISRAGPKPAGTQSQGYLVGLNLWNPLPGDISQETFPRFPSPVQRCFPGEKRKRENPKELCHGAAKP